MNVLCPMPPVCGGNIEELAQAGADEFYFGYCGKFEKASVILSRRHGNMNNFSSLGAVAPVVRQIKTLGLKSYLAINSSFYPPRFISDILEDLDAAVEMGVDGFIMADFNLYLDFRKRHPRAFVAASTCMSATNSGSAGFLADNGFSRIILPRHLSVAEIRKIASGLSGVEFEVFVKNDECPNLDGLCRYFHGFLDNSEDPFTDSEQAKSVCQIISAEHEKATPVLRANLTACGVCDMFHLRDLPNISVKISGRNLMFERLSADVEFVSQAIKGLSFASSFEEYRRARMDSHQAVYGGPCGKKCYRRIIG